VSGRGGKRWSPARERESKGLEQTRPPHPHPHPVPEQPLQPPVVGLYVGSCFCLHCCCNFRPAVRRVRVGFCQLFLKDSRLLLRPQSAALLLWRACQLSRAFTGRQDPGPVGAWCTHPQPIQEDTVSRAGPERTAKPAVECADPLSFIRHVRGTALTPGTAGACMMNSGGGRGGEGGGRGGAAGRAGRG